jgi:YfiH family protein
VNRSKRPEPTAGWRLEKTDGVTIVRHEALLAVPGVGHAFSTRRSAGPDDFDLGPAGPPTPAVERRRRALLRAADLDGRRPGLLRQVHGTAIVRLTSTPPADEPTADGCIVLRADADEWAPAVRTADCVPLLIVADGGRAVAAVHAGWRGTAGGIAERAVAELGALGIPPGGLIALLGPAVGPCCYEVSHEVLERVATASGVPPRALVRGERSGRPRLDLSAANRAQLGRAGLRDGAVHAAPWCTSCDADLFFSYRRDGEKSGRQMACVGWTPGSAP